MKLPEPGDIFEGYQIGELIGSGGFARVYAATTVDIGRDVALKILAPGPTGYDPTLVRRFIAEARAVASLNDPHTLSLFSHGRAADGLLYMAFERLGGEDLNTLLGRRGTLSEPEAIHIVRQVLSSLREAHERGLLHRDIKPENVRVYRHLDDPHFVKVMDFGIAKSVVEDDTPLTRTGHIIGTPRYMAPEQFMDVPLTPAADVYSVGLVLYDMLFGLEARAKPSITGMTVAASAGLSAHLTFVLNRALAGLANERFANAAAMLQAIDEPPSQELYDFTPSSGSWASRSATVSASDSLSSREQRPRTSPKSQPIAMVLGVFVCLGAVAAAGIYLKEPERTVAPEPTRRSNPFSSKKTEKVARPAEPVEVEPSPDPAATGCERAARPGHSVVQETIGLDAISWPVYIPKGYEAGRRHALIILVHDQLISADTFIRHPALLTVADEHNIILYAPEDDFVEPWTKAADQDFILQGLDVVKRELCVDPNRVFAVGHGRGSKIAERLACRTSIAGVAGTNYTAKTKAGKPCAEPVPQIYLHGMDDPFHPGAGGENCTGKVRESVDERDSERRGHRGCSGAPSKVLESQHGHCLAWDCDVPYVSCRLKRGHNWPGMEDRVIDTAGCENAPPKFPYAETIWTFFEHGKLD